MKHSTARRLAILAAGSAALALSACQEADDQTPVETNVMNIGEPENIVVEEEVNMAEPVAVEPTPEPTPARLPKEFGNEQTTIEDAEAVGMTTRLPRADQGTTEPAQ